MRRFVLPRLRDCLFISVFVGALLLGSRMLNEDSDLGRHLILGNYVLNSGTIPVRDILSFTEAGRSRPPYEWLSQVAYTLAFRVLNLDGVVLLAALAIAAAFLVAYVDSLDRSQAPVLALGFAVWSALASSLHWLTRPHVFSFLLFALWLRGLERIRTGHAVRLWSFPLLMLIWANVHGGFVFGALAWAAYGAGWLWDARRGNAVVGTGRKLLFVGGASLVASIITPVLWGNWDAVLQNRSTYVLSRTVETMPPDFSAPGTYPFLGLLLVTGVILILRFRESAPAHWLLLSGLSVMSLIMARNIPLFAIAAGPIATDLLAQSLAGGVKSAQFEKAILNIEAGARGFLWSSCAVVGAIVWLSLHQISTRTATYAFDPRIFPVGATNWLESHPISGHMFNDFNWGGYLLYRLWPQQRVFIDSQSDFYGEDLTRQYEAAVLGKAGWQQLLGKYQVGWIIVPASSGLSAQAATDPSWELLYTDGLASIFGARQFP